MQKIYTSLNPEKALIWRTTHISNLTWILGNGLHAANSSMQACYKPIGNLEVINRRNNRKVRLPPYGVLSDYIPFYFTPFSPMMLNILTGRGVTQYQKNDLVIFVASLRTIEKLGIKFLFTDRHAYFELANYFDDLEDLSKLDWKLWQHRDFQRDPDAPEKMDRYQAEALIHRRLPIENIEGIVCYTNELELQIKELVNERGLSLKVIARPTWYFE